MDARLKHLRWLGPNHPRVTAGVGSHSNKMIKEDHLLCMSPRECLRYKMRPFDSLRSLRAGPERIWLTNERLGSSRQLLLYTTASGHTSSRLSDYSLVKELKSRSFLKQSPGTTFVVRVVLFSLPSVGCPIGGGEYYRPFSGCQRVIQIFFSSRLGHIISPSLGRKMSDTRRRKTPPK
jgi:hypothetical protein